MRLVKLEELKEIKPFDCGDEDLNGFFMKMPPTTGRK